MHVKSIQQADWYKISIICVAVKKCVESMDCELTSSCGGTGPGSILLAAEYIFGMCVSLLQRTHSDVCACSLRLGKPSEQVLRVTLQSVF